MVSSICFFPLDISVETCYATRETSDTQHGDCLVLLTIMVRLGILPLYSRLTGTPLSQPLHLETGKYIVTSGPRLTASSLLHPAGNNTRVQCRAFA
jgi:hypothetical protein